MRASRRIAVTATCVVALAGAAPAAASIEVARDAQRPALRVDARGNAEVSWTEGGVRRYLLVPARGRVLPGARLPGRDVSRPVTRPSIPFRRVLRRTPDGRLWALQAWQGSSRPSVQLRFSRWRGAPTRVEASVADGRLEGRAAFAGRPVTGFSPTPEGKRGRHYAWVDCFACLGSTGWRRLIGVRTRADGTFRLALRPTWTAARYRVGVNGPNRGSTLAPDAAAVVAAPIP